MKAGTENVAGSMGIEMQKIALIGSGKVETGRPEVDSKIIKLQTHLNETKKLVGHPGFEPGTKAFRFVPFTRLPGLSLHPNFRVWDA